MLQNKEPTEKVPRTFSFGSQKKKKRYGNIRGTFCVCRVGTNISGPHPLSYRTVQRELYSKLLFSE